MGYSIYIGNAVSCEVELDEDEEGREIQEYERYDIEHITHPDAPVFLEDTLTSNSNYRSPSYGGWSGFLRETNLTGLFNAELMKSHPGICFLDKEKHLDVIQNYLKEYIISCSNKPSYNPGKDYNLIRLIWLEWWVRWALENCQQPALYNT